MNKYLPRKQALQARGRASGCEPFHYRNQSAPAARGPRDELRRVSGVVDGPGQRRASAPAGRGVALTPVGVARQPLGVARQRAVRARANVEGPPGGRLSVRILKSMLRLASSCCGAQRPVRDEHAVQQARPGCGLEDVQARLGLQEVRPCGAGLLCASILRDVSSSASVFIKRD